MKTKLIQKPSTFIRGKAVHEPDFQKKRWIRNQSNPGTDSISKALSRRTYRVSIYVRSLPF